MVVVVTLKNTSHSIHLSLRVISSNFLLDVSPPNYLSVRKVYIPLRRVANELYCKLDV